MPDPVFESILFSFTVIASGFYSGSEAALVSLSIDRTKQLIEEGGSKGKALQFLADNANEVLSTLLVGNNLVNIFAASYATSIAQRYFANDALAISVGITTAAILIFGEIIPKTFARNHAERFAVFIIRVLQINYFLFFPLIKALTWLVKLLLGKNAELSGRHVTKSDIEFMVNKAEKDKTIDSKQLDLLSSILEFPTIKVKDIMVPRNKARFILHTTNFYELGKILLNSNHSRYPVCEKDLDHVIGFLHVKDLVFMNLQDRKNFDIQKYLKAPFFVYEHMKIQAVFDHMNRKKVHLALVKDESGLVVGIVTLEDIMEEIFGEIQDEHDKESTAQLTTEKDLLGQGVLVDGHLSLRDLSSKYDIKIPLNDNYSTLAGFLLDMIGNNFPKNGMMIFWEGFSFRLENVEDQEIKSVRICDVEGDKHIYPKEESDEDENHHDSENSEKFIEDNDTKSA